ncbi:MAG: cytidylate kinase-like family protein [Clostridiales bacterium]|nr:cytidylate kinase-like family protein [Clostridiales bacterium]
MKTNRVITLARQLGSGGRQIGKLLAERLEIPFYDKELLVEAAKQSGLSQTAFEEADEKPTNSFLYSLSVGSHMMAGAYTDYSQFLSNDQLFLKQAEAVRRIAEEGPCVIVGRCADYVLRENPRLISVYVHADLGIRVKRIVELEKLSEDKARAYVLKADKKRGNYYNFYTGKDWNRADSYDYCVDAGKLGVQGSERLIEEIVRLSEGPDPAL